MRRLVSAVRRLAVRRRRLVVGGAAVAGVAVVALVAWQLLYGSVAAWAIRSRVLPRVEARLGRQISVGAIDAGRGQVVLEDVAVKGLAAGDPALVVVPRVVAKLAPWSAFGGAPTVTGIELQHPEIMLVRRVDGSDNLRDVLARLGGEGTQPARGAGRPRPHLAITGGAVMVDDQAAGVRARGQLALVAAPGRPVAIELTALAVETAPRDRDAGQAASAAGLLGVSAGAERVAVSVSPSAWQAADVSVTGGRLRLWRGLSLTGIHGTLHPAAEPGRLAVELEGGYGGVAGALWTASGWVEPGARRGAMALRAERFTFDRLRPILEGSPIQDFDATSIDVALSVTVDHGVGEISGQVDLSRLTVFHPMLADEPVRDLSFAADIQARFDLAQRTAELVRGLIDYKDVGAKLTGSLRLPGGRESETDELRTAPRVTAHLVVPAVPCQEVLDVLPPELTPHMQGFVLRGMFDADVELDIDWQALEQTRLGGSIGIWGCKIKEVPEALDAERFLGSFEHTVPDVPGEFRPLVIGPENPEFAPLPEISSYLVSAVLTREDGRFFRHRGFISSEFQSALVKNLEAGYFRYGASSISMQLTKNLLLYRDKLLARKLQELFLTWYLESVLDKGRLLEIYLNAIEYGPGIYGVGAAARHYFDKRPSELSPVEAAWLAVILPAPKARYEYYCRNKLSRTLSNRIPRTLDKMVERGLMTIAERLMADVFPLTFYYPADFDEKACLERIEAFTPEQAVEDDEEAND